MTVQELIDRLEKIQDKQKKVELWSSIHDDWCEIKEVDEEYSSVILRD